jgi:hypothetical protein
MTDISKYKNVSLSKDTYTKIDKLRRNHTTEHCNESKSNNKYFSK